MKNKVIFFLLFIFFTEFSFSQNNELNYVITEDTVEYYREYENVKTKKIQKGTILSLNSLSNILYKSDFSQINSVIFTYPYSLLNLKIHRMYYQQN
ncbi:hypothetical protein [Treponema sp.]|uniref:hypothetical protein n=1 Tax=Treponema sp. TaxID=166 RepID=UPI00257B089E|nr:hypothetical protein [Treponema sp.]